MPRLIIHLTDGTHRALSEAAARSGRSMDSLVEESLELSGILASGTAQEIVARARSSAGLSNEDAMALAVREIGRHRAGRDD